MRFECLEELSLPVQRPQNPIENCTDIHIAQLHIGPLMCMRVFRRPLIDIIGIFLMPIVVQIDGIEHAPSRHPALPHITPSPPSPPVGEFSPPPLLPSVLYTPQMELNMLYSCLSTVSQIAIY